MYTSKITNYFIKATADQENVRMSYFENKEG